MSAHFYTAEELAEASRAKLDIVAEARGLHPDGTGADGYVTVEDLRVAIATDQDRTGVNPGLVAEPEAAELVTYVVTGGAPVYGLTVGETFTAYATSQIDRLVEAGAITPAADDEEPIQKVVPPTPDIIEEPDGAEPSEDHSTEES